MSHMPTRTAHLVTLRSLVRPAATVLLGIGAACGGDTPPSDRAAAAIGESGKEQAGLVSGAAVCANADTTPVGLAVRDFITKASPTPQRYLSAAGTDSAIPDEGFKVLQDKGPTYFYSSDTSAQRTIRDKLAEVGPYASLLVVYRGQTPVEGGRAVDLRLGGHYVGGTHDGKVAATKRYTIRCDSTRWRIERSAEEPGT